MKFVNPNINEIFDFNINPIYVLCIENPQFYYEFISDIMEEYNGGDGKSVFSENDKIILAKKCVEPVTDFVNFDINKTTILSKVNLSIEQKAMDETHIEETQRLLAYMERFIDDILLTYDANFYCDKLTIAQVIKACGIKAETETDSLIDKVYTYMNLVREFLGERLFIFVNLRSFINDEAFYNLCNTIKNHDFRVLFLENKAYNPCEYGKTVIIDRDLCVI